MKRCFFHFFKSTVVIFAKIMPPRRRQTDRDARHTSGKKTKSSSSKSKFRSKLPNTSTTLILAAIFCCSIFVGYAWWKHYLRSRLYTPIVARRMTSRSELGDMGDIRRSVCIIRPCLHNAHTEQVQHEIMPCWLPVYVILA